MTKMSSKGQIVIPIEMRTDFNKDEKFVIIKVGQKLIIKSAKDFNKNLQEDLIFAKRTEEAWRRYERGESIGPISTEEFKKRKSKW